MVRGSDGQHIAVEIKRRGDIDGVEQLTRYLDLLGRDPLLTGIGRLPTPSRSGAGVRTLAEGPRHRVPRARLHYMKGIESGVPRLF